MFENFFKNKKLNRFRYESGERQTSLNLRGIRSDHSSRYKLALSLVTDLVEKKKCNIGDFFCGNGYGSKIMSEREGSHVWGLDASDEAIKVAQKFYSEKNVFFSVKPFPFTLPVETFDFITCFESLEHIEDDAEFARQMVNSLKENGFLMISVPNQQVHDLSKNPNEFHFRHYTSSSLEDIFENKLSLKHVKKWWQNVYRFNSRGIKEGPRESSEMLPCEGEDQGENIIILYQKKSN